MTRANLSSALDISFQNSESALRRVARYTAREMEFGHELLLINTNSGGATFALNTLLTLQRLNYRHTIVVGYDSATCSTLHEAVWRLPRATRLGLLRLPCVVDSWWERHVDARKRFSMEKRQGAWMVRWTVFARLVRLGYNVLSFDTDGAIVSDIYPHLHSNALCGRFSLMYASDYERHSPWLQTGFVYACGARRDGAAAWAIAEVVDRYLRFADACGGAYEGDPDDEDGTRCPPGSWLWAARQYGGLQFDQYIHRGVIHSSAMRDGRMMWSQLEDMASTAWPWMGNRTACLEVEAVARSRGIGLPIRDGPPPTPGMTTSRGSGLSQSGAPSQQWTRSDLLTDDVASMDDVSTTWSRRFGLASSATNKDASKAFWAVLRAAVPLASQLPSRAGRALDLEASCEAAKSRDPDQRKGSCRGLPPLPSTQQGLLPHKRGKLSRAWQRILDLDLGASSKHAAPGGKSRRLTIPPGSVKAKKRGDATASTQDVNDGSGAQWAMAPFGDEAIVLLPHWITSHWTVAQQGLVGTMLPRTLFFHAANANKELSLKTNGYWFYDANAARSPRDHGAEAAIFGVQGARPRVIAYEPIKTEGKGGGGGEDGLGTPDEASHSAEVLTPLLLAAAASGRVAALPELSCKSVPWASKAWATPAMRRPSRAPYSFGDCRTGACSFNMIATGIASESQRIVDAALVGDLSYSSPFAVEGTDAMEISHAPLRCVPMNGAEQLPMSRASVVGLDAPSWRRYERLLENERASKGYSSKRLDGLGTRISYAALQSAMDGVKDATVVYLPRRRLKVVDVPTDAHKACGECKLPSSEYEVEGASTATEGYCEETNTGDAGDCDAGEKGSWRLGSGNLTSVHGCVWRCAHACARCQYVSVSLPEHDCSWYASCQMGSLHNAGLGHRTFHVDDEVKRRLKPPPTVETVEEAPRARRGRRGRRRPKS